MGFGAKKLKASRATRLEKPPKGFFFFAGRTYPRVKWWQKPNLRRLYFYCIILIFVNIANGFDGSMMNSLQSLPYWQNYFGHPTGAILGLLGSSMSLGSIIGLIAVPWVCDRLGRKKGVILGSSILVVGVALQAGAANYGMFLSARFVLGFGMAFATNAGPLLCAEIAHPQDRAIITTFMGCSYAVGSFVAAWTTYGTLQIKSDWAWRLPSLLQAWATIVVLTVIWFIPESPRFYMNRDEHHKALQMLAKYHGEGNEHDEFVQLEYTEIRTALELDKEANRNSEWLDLVRTKGNRHRISLIVAIALFGQWSGNGIIAYYLKLILDDIGIKTPKQQLGINGGSKAMSLLVNLFAAFYIDRLGRRPILMASTVGMLTCFVLWTILSARYAIEENPSAGLGRGVVALIYMYNFSYNLK
jgi:sugar porter (SP) family MFS transporter